MGFPVHLGSSMLGTDRSLQGLWSLRGGGDSSYPTRHVASLPNCEWDWTFPRNVPSLLDLCHGLTCRECGILPRGAFLGSFTVCAHGSAVLLTASYTDPATRSSLPDAARRRHPVLKGVISYAALPTTTCLKDKSTGTHATCGVTYQGLRVMIGVDRSTTPRSPQCAYMNAVRSHVLHCRLTRGETRQSRVVDSSSGSALDGRV